MMTEKIKKRFQAIHSDSFFSYALPYILVFLIVFVFLLLMRGEAYRITYDYSINIYEKKLQDGIYQWDSLLDQTSEIGNFIQQDAMIQSLFSSDTETLKQDIPRLLRLKKFIHNMHAIINNHASFTFLLFNHNDIIATNQFIDVEGTTAYPLLFSFDDLDYNDWRSQIAQATRFGNLSVLPSQTLYSLYFPHNSSGKKVNLILIPLRNTHFSPCSVIAFAVESDYLFNIIGNTEDENGIFLSLFDSAGNLLCSSSDTNDLSAIALSDTYSKENNKYIIDNKEYSVITTSGKYGHQVVCAIPNIIIENLINQINRIFIIYVFCSLLCLCGFVIFYIRLHAYPLSRLVQQSNTISSKNRKHFQSPYSYVGDLLSSLQDTQLSFEQKLLQLENEYSRDLLESACQRSIFTTAELTRLNSLLVWCKSHYRILLLESKAFSTNHSIQIQVKETMGSYIKALPLSTIDSEMLFIVSADETNQLIQKAVDSIALSLMERGFETRIGISSDSQKPEDIHVCYYNARKKLQAYHLFNPLQSLAQETLQQDKSILPAIEISSLNSLSNIIFNGDAADIEACFEKFQNILVSSPVSQTPDWIAVLHMILQETAQRMNSIPASPDSYHADDPARALESLKEYALTLNKMFHSQRGTGLINEIMLYIRNNCHDANLSADVIGEHLHYSRRYIYAFIKQSTGCSPGDLIDQARLELACQLLSSTHLTNEEIAKRAGFGTLATFYRLFKKHLHTSPGSWRAVHSK